MRLRPSSEPRPGAPRRPRAGSGTPPPSRAATARSGHVSRRLRPLASPNDRRRRRPESNWCARLCRPLPNHSATAPSRAHRSETVLSVTGRAVPPLYLGQLHTGGPNVHRWRTHHTHRRHPAPRLAPLRRRFPGAPTWAPVAFRAAPVRGRFYAWGVNGHASPQPAVERCLRCSASMEWRHGTWQCPRCRFKLGCCEGESPEDCGR